MFIESILGEKGGTVFTVPATATVAELVSELARHNIGAVIVTGEDGKLVGIVSERDVVRHLDKNAEGILQRPVSELMTKTLKTCRKTDTIDTAMSIMTRGRFRHIPVVEDGEMIGIISIGDVVKRKIEEVEQETDALREYISS